MEADRDPGSPYAKWWMASYVGVAIVSFAQGIRLVLARPASTVADVAPALERLGDVLVEMPYLLPLNLLLAPILLAVLVGLQTFNPFSARVWHRPSWRRCPFTAREPLQAFHLAGWAVLAAGLGACCAAPFASEPMRFLAGYVALSGVGILFGVAVSTRLYART
jgi:hypothetical protein